MRNSTARIAGATALVGAIAQIAYGLLAVVVPWPAIVNPGAEALWIVANLGMVAGLVGWAGVVARGRTVVVGVAVASLGFLLRIAAGVVSMGSPTADVLPLVLGSIALTLGGALLTAVGSLLVRPWRSPATWLPAIWFVVELGLASMYSLATALHFVLLGAVWGLVSLAIAVTVLRHGARVAAASGSPAPEASR